MLSPENSPEPDETSDSSEPEDTSNSPEPEDTSNSPEPEETSNDPEPEESFLFFGDMDREGDLILHCAEDDVGIRVFKVILAQASCVFHDMFSLPQQPKENWDLYSFRYGMPAVQITEDSATVKLVLKLLYPTPPPELKDLAREIIPVLEMGRTYQMELVTTHARVQLMKLVDKYPAGVYTVARRFEMEDELMLAGMAWLKKDYSDIHQSELVVLSSHDVLRLVRCHRACAEVAVETARKWEELQHRESMRRATWFRCDDCPEAPLPQGSPGDHPPRQWFISYVEEVAAALERRPHASTILDDRTIVSTAYQSAFKCGTCSQNLFEMFPKFQKLLAEEVQDVTELIVLQHLYFRNS